MATRAGRRHSQGFKQVLFGTLEQTAVDTHTRPCVVMPDCEKSGHGIFTTDNRILAFDVAGNAQAAKGLLEVHHQDVLHA